MTIIFAQGSLSHVNLSWSKLITRHEMQVYATAAMLEWATDRNDKVVRNVFELGLAKFMGTAEYVLEYAAFLRSLADHVNVRALFERALAEAGPEAARKLWDAYVEVFSCCNSLHWSMLQVEELAMRACGTSANMRLDLLCHLPRRFAMLYTPRELLAAF